MLIGRSDTINKSDRRCPCRDDKHSLVFDKGDIGDFRNTAIAYG